MSLLHASPWFLLGASSLFANSAGLENDINDAFTMANGGAVTARAANAATNWYNPAGISKLKGRHLNMTLSREVVEYQHQPSTAGGGKIEAADHFIIPAMYFTSNFDYRWSWGISVNSPYGLSFAWNNPAIRYIVTKSEFKSMYVTPSLSYAVDENLSFALGINASRSSGELNRSVNLTAVNTALNSGKLSTSPDAQSHLVGEDAGLGFNLGAMYNLNDHDTLGLVYRSRNTVRLDGDLTISGLNGTSALVFGGSTYKTSTVLEFNLPPSISLGYKHKMCDQLTMELDLEWVQWSELDDFSVRYKTESNATRLLVLNTDNPSRKDYSDTVTIAYGMEYAINPRHALSAGTRYRPSPVPDETADPIAPVNDIFNLDLGYSYIMQRSRLDFVLAHAWSKTRSIDNNVGASSLASADGKYSLYAQVFGASYNFNF